MSVPNSYALALYVDGVNIIEHCPYEEMDLEDLVHDPSTFSFKVENASAISIAQNMQVLVYSISTSPVRLIFSGYILKFRQSKRDNGITIEYEVDCEDNKVRLQKSVIPAGNYQGLDTDILQDLLDNTHPDLSNLFDFSDLVNSFADDLNLDVNDDNLLDKLKELADQAGAKYRFERNDGGEALITFESDGWGGATENPSLLDMGYHFYNGAAPDMASSVSATGNPGSCVRWLDKNNGTISNGSTICLLEINLGGEHHVNEIEFDYFSSNANVQLYDATTGGTQALAGTSAWHSHTFPIDFDSDIIRIGFKATAAINTNAVTLDLRFDNVRLGATTPIPEGTLPKEKLVWDAEADVTDFDFDIDLSDEYGSDFDLDVGGFDDFNSIIVTGGKTEHAIEWTYHSNAIEEHLGLELPVKDIAVYKNTGSFGSPVWDALDLGQWGVDKLNSETGGTKEVLYDTVNHWLYFDTADIPPNLENAVKVEGFILRPIRVKTEIVGAGEPIYATTLYDESITSEEQAAQIGFNELQKRKALRQMTLKTHHPGLKVGQKLGITDSTRGLDESLMIQRLHVTWKNNLGCFEAECGNEESSNASILIANTDKRSRKKAAPAAIGTTNYEALLDSDGTVLYDSDGTVLYGSAS